MENERCPLCRSQEARYFYQAFEREYHRCSNCFLVFVPQEFHLPKHDHIEFRHTDFEQSKKFRQSGKNQYFTLLTNQVLKKCDKGAIGLDFNCGEKSFVSDIFSQNGKLIKLYDEKVKRDETILEDIYDFITVVHQIETYQNPREYFDKFYELLAADGILAIMCTPLCDLSMFNSWKFMRSPHHVAFYHLDTFEWIAKKYNYKLEIFSETVVIFSQL